MVPWQPAYHPVVLTDVHTFRMATQIMQQGLMRDGDAGGETGRTARILQIADVVRLRFGQRRFRRGALAEAFPAFAQAALLFSGDCGHVGDFFRIEQDLRVAAFELDAQLLDIVFLAAERRRQGQRHRPCPGVDAGAEQGCEVGAGLRDQRDAVVLADPGGDQTVRHRQRIFAHLAERIRPFQRAAHIVKI